MKKTEKVLKYKPVNLDQFDETNKLTVPSYYHKQIETVNEENQKTNEKNWSMKEPLYEVTQEMIELLQKHEVKILPKDAELVIDLWEKIAVNDGKQGKKHLMNEFRRIYASDKEL